MKDLLIEVINEYKKNSKKFHNNHYELYEYCKKLIYNQNKVGKERQNLIDFLINEIGV